MINELKRQVKFESFYLQATEKVMKCSVWNWINLNMSNCSAEITVRPQDCEFCTISNQYKLPLPKS